MPRDVTPQHMLHRLLKRIALIKAAITNQISPTQRRYRRDFDKNVPREPTFDVDDYKFVDRSKLAFIASGAADEIANRR